MKANRAVFVTGTDTGVGKTRVASAIARALRNSGRRVGVMKPVETGCALKDGALFPADAAELKDASLTCAGLELICPYRFSPPLAPETAAGLVGAEIDFERIREIFIGLSKAHEFMIVEGAGGLLVPVSGGRTMAGLASHLGLPLLIVSANRLGTLNHTLLTVHAARTLGLEVKGIVLNNAAPADASAPYNRASLERLSGAPVLAEFPFQEKEEAHSLAGEGLLRSVFSL